jgi:hypothetical protein
MENFLKETLEILALNNKKESDIEWVGNKTHRTSWEQLKSISNIEYNNDYGSPKIAEDLMIVGKDWWLERNEYDGLEWWEYKEFPTKPETIIDLKAIETEQAESLGYQVIVGWNKLLELNGIIDIY